MKIIRPHSQTFLLGDGIATVNPWTAMFSNILQPRSGGVTVVPGRPNPLSLGVVAALGGTVLLLAILKKKKVF